MLDQVNVGLFISKIHEHCLWKAQFTLARAILRQNNARHRLKRSRVEAAGAISWLPPKKEKNQILLYQCLAHAALGKRFCRCMQGYSHNVYPVTDYPSCRRNVTLVTKLYKFLWSLILRGFKNSSLYVLSRSMLCYCVRPRCANLIIKRRESTSSRGSRLSPLSLFKTNVSCFVEL